MSYPKWSKVNRDPALLAEALRTAAEVIRGDRAFPTRAWFTSKHLADYLTETATKRVFDEYDDDATARNVQEHASSHPAEMLIREIDWDLLRSQKLSLLAKGSGQKWADGLLTLLDEIQDCAVDNLGIDEKNRLPIKLTRHHTQSESYQKSATH